MEPTQAGNEETELKLSIPPEQAGAVWRAPALSALLRERPVRRGLFSAYYDTPAFLLRDHGVALRLRRTGRQWVQTLKKAGEAVGGLHTRIEHEAAVPAQLLNFAAIAAADDAALFDDEKVRRALTVIFTTEFSRTSAMVEPGPGERVEVSVDQGVITAGARREPLCEIELELKQGDPRSLFQLARRLAEALPVRLDNRSKAQRGYRLAEGAPAQPVKAERIALAADAGVDETFRAIAGACLLQLQANEQGILTGRDPEYLHQARVALRRLRSAFGVFSGSVPREAVGEQLATLRAIAGVLGEARDWDVFTGEFLRDALAGVRGQAAAAALERRALALRARARRRARALLRSREYTLALLTLAQTLHTMAWREERGPAHAAAAAMPLREFAAQVLDRRARRVRKLGRRIDHDDAAQLHALRIRVKKLRYAGEFFATLYSRKPARAWLSRLEALQTVLGRLSDNANAARLLDALAPPRSDADGSHVLAYVRGFVAARAQSDGSAVDAALRRAGAATPFWHGE